MKLYNNLVTKLLITAICVISVACDEVPQQADSSTIDRKSLDYGYFVDDGTDGLTHANISTTLALLCGASTCHGVGGGNGGTFKIYNPADTDAKHVSNFISAQGQVIRGEEDTSPTVVSDNYPLAHTSPLLNKALSEAAGGTVHKGGGPFTDRAVVVGTDYGEIYRWIAYDRP